MTPLKTRPEDCPFGRDVIEHYLPHRDPIRLVDRVISFNETSITTEVDLAQHHSLFQGHFPGRAILPGIYMIEMAAQAGALLAALNDGFEDGKFIGFSGVDNVKFRVPVKPNEILQVHVDLVKIRLPFYKFKGKVQIKGKAAVSLDFTASLMNFNG
jgi:3-hydroxyacyl-[acyl-carrier-protein] dehydratase